MAGKKPTLETGGKAHGARDTKTLPQRRISGPLAETIATHETPARQAKSGPKLCMEDRDLLQCPRCGLLEDVGCYGLLMTYFSGKPPVDSGLRFRKDKRGRYICPNCGAVAGMEKEGRTTT
jgi:hypothetical protein